QSFQIHFRNLKAIWPSVASVTYYYQSLETHHSCCQALCKVTCGELLHCISHMPNRMFWKCSENVHPDDLRLQLIATPIYSGCALTRRCPSRPSLRQACHLCTRIIPLSLQLINAHGHGDTGCRCRIHVRRHQSWCSPRKNVGLSSDSLRLQQNSLSICTGT
ncbi:hypothetical protein KC19_8G157800, partial [Ceratodon purpureus]